MISEETQQEIVSAKMYDRKTVGELSGLWWCAVDTLLVSLQKLIKVKKIVDKDSVDKKERKVKVRKKEEKADKEKDGEDEELRVTLAKVEKKPPPKGRTLTKIRPSIEMARVYCLLEPEIAANEKFILKAYEDPNHVFLILEGLFF